MRIRLGLTLILFTFIVALIGWSIVSYLQLELNLDAFLAVPIFLGLVEGGVILFINKYLQGSGRTNDVFLFVTKMSKMALSIIFALVGYKLLNWGTPFLIVFLVYYFVFIMFESWMFIKCNKALRQKIENHE